MSSFGENLRRERELRGVSLRDIAEATKISTRFLEAIEQDRLEILPGGIFPRSFVRQYARHLGLDADRIVAEFVFQHPPETRPTASAPPNREWQLRAGVAVTVAALGLAALWFVRPSPREAAVETAGSAPSSLAPLPASPAPTVYRPAAPAEPRTQPQAAPQGGVVITLTALKDCWVGVQADGQEVLNRVLAEGDSRTLRARQEILLSVGNAGGLALRVGGRPGISLGGSGEVRHDIVINAENLDSFVAKEAPSASQPASPNEVGDLAAADAPSHADPPPDMPASEG